MQIGRPERYWVFFPVPFLSAEFVEVTKFTGPSECIESLRGGIRSLMRSSPRASSKLRILCCGEKPRMAAERETRDMRTRRSRGSPDGSPLTHARHAQDTMGGTESTSRAIKMGPEVIFWRHRLVCGTTAWLGS